MSAIVQEIAGRITANLGDFEARLQEFLGCMPLSHGWIQREWPLSEGQGARALLTGAKIAFLEAGTAWAIGSNRGAASSLRVYIENVVAWLYYKDHPVEYRMISNKSSDLNLPKSVQSYLKSTDKDFERAYTILLKAASRSDEYYYTNISQYVHAHPSFAALSDKVEDVAICHPVDKGFLQIASYSDEFISDLYLTFYRQSWDDVPSIVQNHAVVRLGPKVQTFVDTV